MAIPAPQPHHTAPPWHHRASLKPLRAAITTYLGTHSAMYKPVGYISYTYIHASIYILLYTILVAWLVSYMGPFGRTRSEEVDHDMEGGGGSDIYWKWRTRLMHMNMHLHTRNQNIGDTNIDALQDDVNANANAEMNPPANMDSNYFPSHQYILHHASASIPATNIFTNHTDSHKQDTYLVFVIQVSPSNTHRLPHLLQALYIPSNTFIIHLDKKIKHDAWKQTIVDTYRTIKQLIQEDEDKGNDIDIDSDQAIKEIIKILPRYHIYLMPRRLVSWGGISIIVNVLEAMEYINNLDVLHSVLNYDQSRKHDWSHMIILSPTSYPLIHPNDMTSILHKFQGESFIHTESFQSYMDHGDTRVTTRFKYTKVDHSMYDDPMEKVENLGQIAWNVSRLPKGDFYKGEFWSVFAKPAVQLLLESSLTKEWLIRLSTVQIPDELFFQVVSMKQPDLKLYTRNLCLHYASWISRLTGKSLIHPQEFTDPTHDFDILQTSASMFARKFGDRSSQLLERIRTELHGNSLYAEQVYQRMKAACFLAQKGCTNRHA